MTLDTAHDFERYAVTAALVLLVLGCYLVVRPFLTAFLWGAIISISTRGIYSRVVNMLGGRRRLAASLTVFGLAAVLLVPIAALGLNLAGRWPALDDQITIMMSHGLSGPPPWLAELPLVGSYASNYWHSAAAKPDQLRQELLPLIKPVKDFIFAFTAGIGRGVLDFALALLIAGLLYVRGEGLGAVLGRIADRLGGDGGRRLLHVIESTVRGVLKGVIGTAAVQGVLAIFGFWLAGVPNVLILGMATFFLSVIPGGPIFLWLPAALWLYANGHTGWAMFMGIWGAGPVGSSDNLIRPLLIGKEVEAPAAVIFLGVIGGILAFGFLGLFIGPTMLAVAYNLLQDWMGGGLIGNPARTET
jgi:predicted PurR-regulated permease PerM